MSVFTTQDPRYVYDPESGTRLEVQHGTANLTTGIGTLAAPASGFRHLVLGVRMHAAGAGEVYFMSGTNAISEKFQPGANGGAMPGYWPTGHFQTAAGEALTGTYTGSGTCGLGVSYVSYKP